MNPKVQCAMNITKEQQKKNAFKPTSERERASYKKNLAVLYVTKNH